MNGQIVVIVVDFVVVVVVVDVKKVDGHWTHVQPNGALAAHARLEAAHVLRPILDLYLIMNQFYFKTI